MSYKRIRFFSLNDDGKRCMDALRLVLKKENVSTYRYSIGGYSEEAVCIEKDKEFWNVYDGERGRKCNLKSFFTAKQGCIEVLKRIFVNRGSFIKACRTFYSELEESTVFDVKTDYYPEMNISPKFSSCRKRANMRALKTSAPTKIKKEK